MQKGNRQIKVATVRAWLPRLMRENPQAALAFLDLALGLREAGLIVSLAPHVLATQALALEVLDVEAAAGELAATTAEALADRHVSSDEAEALTQAADKLERQTAEVRALAAQARHPSFPAVSP